MATYAISDLHGQYEIFEKLLERIEFCDKDFLYVLGDAIDRGPDGIKLLQKIMLTPNMDLLIGNHEFMMLNSVDPKGSADELPGKDASLWIYYNGGDQTFDCYEMLTEAERKELLSWLNSRLLTTLVEVSGKTFCLTHSSFDTDHIGKKFEDCSYGDVWDIVWNTPYRADLYIPVEEYAKTGYEFLIGHVPVQRVAGPEKELTAYREKNITLIDGGCSFRPSKILAEDKYGVICIKLDDMSETIVTFAEL